MRKRWLISFIVAFVALAGAAALLAVGFVQMTPRVVRQEVGGFFSSMEFSYASVNTNLGFALIFLGGILVLASVLLFILSEVIRSHEECCDCCDADFIEEADMQAAAEEKKEVKESKPKTAKTAKPKVEVEDTTK